MEQHEGILETAIVSARKGRDARLLRGLETRQKFKLRQEGCLSAWISPSEDKQPIYLVQTLYDQKVMEKISDDLENKLEQTKTLRTPTSWTTIGWFIQFCIYHNRECEENGEIVSRITMIMRQKQ